MARSITQACSRRMSQLLSQSAASPKARSSLTPRKFATESVASPASTAIASVRSFCDRKASLSVTAVSIDPALLNLVQPIAGVQVVDDGHVPSNVQIATIVTKEGLKPGIKYSVSELLRMRHCQTSTVAIDVPEVIDDGQPARRPDEKPGVLSFRASASGKKALSFHKDMDVTEDCVVTCLGLNNSVDWPSLNTFCKKTVGINPVAVRMDRRHEPARALIIFSSASEATKFVGHVPESARLKGRKPHFRLGHHTSQ